MLSRRDFVQIAFATAALGSVSGRLAAAQALTQNQLLAFRPMGQVTLLHLSDLHAQLTPAYLREPLVDVGIGAARGRPPHLTGQDYLEAFGIPPGSPDAYFLTSHDFEALAREYGRVGGLDRIATLVRAITAERGDRVLLLDSGDSWQGSWTALETEGEAMVRAMNLLGPDAMTGHWEFAYGAERVGELIDLFDSTFLAANARDSWGEPAFEQAAMFEAGGVNVAVIGHAFPHMKATIPPYLIPDWTFSVRAQELARLASELRDEGAELVVLLSHNGFDLDLALAADLPGIDVILSGHGHDSLPEPVVVNGTLVIASGSHGKFVSRLDLDIRDGRLRDFSYRLIPVLADAIAPDAEMAELIEEHRAPYAEEFAYVLGRTATTLYRRDTLHSTVDDVICAALRQELDAEIALSPGFRWGPTLPAGHAITTEFVYAHTAIPYPATYRAELTGKEIKTILEGVADKVFNPDPYLRHGDMLRVSGLGYRIDLNGTAGGRISDLTLLASGEPLDPARRYVVAGWGSLSGGDGPPVWEPVMDYIEQQQELQLPASTHVKITGA